MCVLCVGQCVHRPKCVNVIFEREANIKGCSHEASESTLSMLHGWISPGLWALSIPHNVE